MFLGNLQHKCDIVARAQWVDYEIATPFACQISEHLLDDLFPKFLEFNYREETNR